MKKTADTDHPIHNTLATRWSPYCFADTPVAGDDLAALFEAARWAPSSRNEQPWRFILGRRDRSDGVHAAILGCLAEGNQGWAALAPVLLLGIAVNRTLADDQPNRAAHHDLGLAVGSLLVEATSRGLAVHQMTGLDCEAARRAFDVPPEAEVVTAIAIGRHDTSANRDTVLAEREAKPRTRRAISEFVFTTQFGESADPSD